MAANPTFPGASRPGRDQITIRDLEMYCRVGVPDAERATPQRLWVTVSLTTDVRAAAAADDLTRTIDYADVAERLRALGTGREWKLIETLAVEIAEGLLRDFAVDAVAVEVKKFILPWAGEVSVRVERERT